MRADSTPSKRTADKHRLEGFLRSTYRSGQSIKINDWYEAVGKLGLAHSHRQRLSELRKEGLMMSFDKKTESYLYQGFTINGQLSLGLAA